jgi:type VI secretion system protein ImpM
LGDFVSRRLPARFVETWDAWLQSALLESREHLGSKWLDIYLISPIWRFILSPGICGSTAWTGILMPSVDKVGRYFPLTLAVWIEDRAALPSLFVSAADWFDRLEQLALSALEDDFELTDFDRKLQALSLHLPLPIKGIDEDKNNLREKNVKFAFHMAMEKPDHMTDAFIQLGACLLNAFVPVYSLWSTSGSECMSPSLRVYEDLPPQDAYSELLAGQKKSCDPGIETAASVSSADTGFQEALEVWPQDGALGTPRIQWRSCARSSVGMQRTINEDACLERPEVGLWLVADGMGGHSAGDVASEAVVNALSTLPANDNIGTFTSTVTECLHRVNADLLAMAEDLRPGQIIGTTVVAMMAVGNRCSCIWAGDSRLYRYREGILSQLTHDHSLVAELSRRSVLTPGEAGESISENIITRALGVEPQLVFDTITYEAKEGDVYLLCSDGLIREMTPEEIADILSQGGCNETSQMLIDLALLRGARDNVTVIVIHAGDS